MSSFYLVSIVFLIMWIPYSTSVDISLTVETATMNDTMKETAVKIMKKALLYFGDPDEIVKHVSLSFGAIYDDRNWNVFNVDDNRYYFWSVQMVRFKVTNGTTTKTYLVFT
ncbi:hypothetical protein Trydic_g18210 [Trypoxylus dichotomus]